MGKWISGTLKATINFDNVYVEDGQDEISALFPDGWEGEMDSDLNITHIENEEEDND
jgi:hypothetical protein